MSDQLQEQNRTFPNLRRGVPFDRERARAANRASQATRRYQKLQRELERSRSKIPTPLELNESTLRQIADIDLDMREASPANRVLLAEAKTKLWSLLFAKPKPVKTKPTVPKSGPLSE